MIEKFESNFRKYIQATSSYITSDKVWASNRNWGHERNYLDAVHQNSAVQIAILRCRYLRHRF